MDRIVERRWMKPVSLLLWLATAAVLLWSVGLLVVRPWYQRRMAIAELNRLGTVEITEDSVSFEPSIDVGRDLTSIEHLAILLERIECTELSLGDCLKLDDIQGLRRVRSLQQLSLFRTNVSDLSPLAGLSGLRGLVLYNSPVSDLTPLQGLRGLRTLALYGTPVSDLTPLQGLSGLQDIYLYKDQVIKVPPQLEKAIRRS